MVVNLIFLSFLSIAGGLALAMLLYFRQQQFDNKTVRVALFALRSLAFALLLFVLLAPLIPFKNKTLVKPLIAVLSDNSSSMLSEQEIEQVQAITTNLNEQLARLSEVEQANYVFDGNLRNTDLDFKGAETNLAQALRQVYNTQDKDRLAAVILVSDGIYNRGENPLYVAEEALIPVFSLGVGDSALQRDLSIYAINAPRFAYQGDDVIIEVTVKATALAGEKTTISLLQNKKVVSKKDLAIPSQKFVETINFSINAEKPGLYAYDIEIAANAAEKNTSNNLQRFYLEVIEKRKQISVVSHAPAPDVSAVREALRSVDAYEVDFHQLLDKVDYADTDLLILFLQAGAPPEQYQSLLNAYMGPIWLFIDFQVAPLAVQQILPGATWQKPATTSHSSVVINNAFGLFTISQDAQENLKRLPPRILPTGTLTTASTFINLLAQKQDVVALYGEAEDRRMVIFPFSGLWKLRTVDYRENQSHKTVDEWLQLTAQYLTSDNSKERLNVVYKPRIAIGEQAMIKAEVYDAAFNVTTSAKVDLVLTDEAAAQTSYAMLPKNKAFEVDINGLRAGRYTFMVEARLGAETLRKSGEFLVEDFGLEQQNTRADFNLLNQMAQATKGTFYMAGQEAELLSTIERLPNLKPLERISYDTIPLVDFWWLLIIAIALLGTEWALRRYFGRI